MGAVRKMGFAPHPYSPNDVEKRISPKFATTCNAQARAEIIRITDAEIIYMTDALAAPKG
jgi:hypothetical protein